MSCLQCHKPLPERAPCPKCLGTLCEECCDAAQFARAKLTQPLQSEGRGLSARPIVVAVPNEEVILQSPDGQAWFALVIYHGHSLRIPVNREQL